MTVSDRQLDRLRLGELEPDEARALLEALEEAGESHRLDDLIAASDHYLDHYPAEVAIREIRAAARREGRKPSNGETHMLTSRRILALTAVAATIATATWVVQREPDPPQSTPSGSIRTVQSPARVTQPDAPPRAEIAVEFARAREIEEMGAPREAAKMYRHIIDTFEPGDGPDEYLQSLVRLGLFVDAESRPAFADELFTRAVTAHDELSEKADLGAAATDAAAQAQFMLFDAAAERMFDSGLNLEEELAAVLAAKVAAGETAQPLLEKVLRYDRPSWSVAAHHRLGWFYQHLARSLAASAMRDGSSDEQREQFRRARQSVEKDAIAAYTDAVVLAEQAGITTADSKSASRELTRLQRYRAPRAEAERGPKIEGITDATAEMPTYDPRLADDQHRDAIKAFVGGHYADALAKGHAAIDNGCTTKCYRVIGMAHYKLQQRAEACRWLQKAGSEIPIDLSCE